MSDDGFLPFASPDIGPEEISGVVAALQSNWITTGARAKQFEADFSEWLGGGVEAVAVNSATAGLHLALEAVGVGPGTEVITTTHTFTATAEVVRYLGADPVFVDVCPDTLCIDPELVERAIGPRTRAIIPVHFGGLSADMSAILGVAKGRSIAVIEDAAHALPTTHAGRMIGTLGSDATVFSFYANKTITTGEGGMLVTKDARIASRARTMRLHGISRDAFDRFTSRAPSWFYEVVAPGYKYNLTDVAAAIGIPQLRKAHAFHRRRTEIAEAYLDGLRGCPVRLPSRAVEGDLHSWHLFVLRLAKDAPVGRDAFIERMFGQGIGMSVHYIPLHLQPYWRDTYGLKSGDFPVSQEAYGGCASLPIYTRMTDKDVKRVIAAARKALEA